MRRSSIVCESGDVPAATGAFDSRAVDKCDVTPL